MDVQFDPNNPTRPILYQYTPSLTAGYAFVALFGLCTIAHFIAMIRFRSWFFIPLILGGICETFGYYGRAWSHADKWNFKSFVLQGMLILASPPLISATIYMALGRIITSLNAAKHSMISPRWLTKIYIVIDILIFASQIAGVGLQVTGDRKIMETGRRVLLAGLIFQLVAFVFFILIAWRVQRRLNAEPTSLSQHPSFKWKRYLAALYVVSVCILVRALVRVIEFSQGPTGSIASSEAYLYVFDATLMFLVLLTFLVLHPGRLFQRVRQYCKEIGASENGNGDKN